MKKNKILVCFGSVLIIMFGNLGLLILLKPTYTQILNKWVDTIIPIMSFIISCITFTFSMITYFAIDSVRNITSMEGNVLENENYTVSYEEMINEFNIIKEQKEFTEKLLETIKCPHKTTSCMAFSDCLQKILDHIILFAYIDMNDKEVNSQCNCLIDTIEKEAKRYNKLSNGIRYQLDENVKLIKYILKYQEISSDAEWDIYSKIENVKGRMLKNPISKILYYNYLGLDYRRKAARIIALNRDSENEFGVDNMRIIKKCEYSDWDIKHFVWLIDMADHCCREAQKYTKDNLLWEGYISYNKVRLVIMKYLLFPETNESFLYTLNRSRD